MDAIAARIARQYPSEQGWGVTLVPFQDALTEYIRPALLLLLAAVGFVLMLACANVANLLLARITSRQREIGIRAAMGAGRRRLVGQFLTENVLLSIAGGGVGLLIAVWAVDLLGRALPKTVPLPNAATEVMVPSITIDGRVLLFTFIVSFACALLFGVLPAVNAARPDLNAVLKDTGRTSSGAPSRQRARRLLVISETALAFVLLIGAGLMLRTFINIENTNAGIRPQNVLTFHVKLETDSKYKQRQQMRDFARDALARILAIRMVESAGITDVLPLSQEAERESFTIEGRPAGPNDELMADFRRATPDYFRTMGIAQRGGRGFTAHDNETALPVAIVDESFARAYFPNEGVIGKRLRVADRWRQIVGVVAGVRHYGLDQPPRPTIYFPWAQVPGNRLGIAVRTHANTQAVVAAVKRAIWSVDEDEPVFLVRTMDDYVSLATSAPRIALLLLGIFAALAIVLAALGIYAVVSYTVSQRLPEFGVRIALGARPADVRSMILRSGLRSAAIGLACGFAVIVLLAPVLRAFLYGVGALDMTVIAAASLFLTSVTMLANYMPARRATRVDPMTALRCE
jgi:putative ABC transport system permease protein